MDLVERDISPRSCAMAPGDQNYILHLYPQPELLRESKPGVDMPDNPFSEMAQNEGILASCVHRKGQYGAILSCKRKRVLHIVG